ncbi:MAG: hypothetical protein LBC86_00030 [Oscillospiraceae bacterium]|nr:hypothetical protein [Oscillospiraceae bacterium]
MEGGLWGGGVMAYLPVHRVEVRVMAVGHGAANVVCGYCTIDGEEYLSYLLVNDFGGDTLGTTLVELSELMEVRAKCEKKLNQLEISKDFTHFIDVFVLSHPHDDHYNLLFKILHRTAIIGKLYWPMSRYQERCIAIIKKLKILDYILYYTVDVSKLLSHIDSSELPIGMRFDILSVPPLAHSELDESQDIKNENLYSLVLVFRFPNFVSVFPGDLTAHGMFILHKLIGKTTLLVAPHHGSMNTVAGKTNKGKEVCDLFFEELEHWYHIISANGKHGLPNGLYVKKALEWILGMKTVKHTVCLGDSIGIETDRMIFTTRLPHGNCSFLFKPFESVISDTFGYAYLPNDINTNELLLHWNGNFNINIVTPMAPTSFTFDHQGHTLWQ